MPIKISRAMFPGTHAQYLEWAKAIEEPYRSIFETEDEVNTTEAIALGYAILKVRPLTADSKSVLTALFYAINENENPA